MVRGVVDNVEQRVVNRIDERFSGSGLVGDVVSKIARSENVPSLLVVAQVYRGKCIDSVIIPYPVICFSLQYTIVPDVVCI